MWRVATPDTLLGRTIAPMKGVALDADGALPVGDNWVYELKWDGMRVIVFLTTDDDGEPSVRLQSSNGRDVTVSFPELQSLAELAENFDGLVLDGEIVAFNAEGQPSFNALQQRMHVSDPGDAARRAAHTPVMFVAFDLLHLNGHDTMALPLANRRTLLEQIVEPGDQWRICEQHRDDPHALLDVVIAADLEGIMAKRLDSVWTPGRRSPSWIKIKPRKRQEFVVGGWISGRGTRAGGLGSLLLGYYDGDELLFAGGAGSGLTDATINEWERVLTVQEMCPFNERPPVVLEGRKLYWCVPDQVAEIAFSEWADGHQVRHPVVLGRRTDKAPTDVVREA